MKYVSFIVLAVLLLGVTQATESCEFQIDGWSWNLDALKE
jgi:hypothetical protein